MSHPDPAIPTNSVTRRTLLGMAAGLLLTAAATLLASRGAKGTVLEQEPQAKVEKAAPDPEHDAPGLLAQSRLKPDVVALMTGATRFWARRRQHLSGSIPEGDPATNATVGSTRLPFTMPGALPPKSEEAQMARRLASLLLRDALWTSERSWNFAGTPFQPDFVFTFADTFSGIIVSVSPASHAIRLEWTNAATHAACTSSLLLDPVGEEMIAFIKDAFPGDALVQALTFTPAPAPPLPIPTCPPEIPAAVWEKITALKPGMTRADVLRVFEEEGGLSNRLGRTYTLRKFPARSQNAEHPPCLKINVGFAPADFPLLWRGGKGFLQNAEDVPKAARGREMPGDIITSISSVYWGYFTAD